MPRPSRIPPTLLGPLRRPAPVIAAVGLVVFVVLAVRYAGDPTAGRVDEHVESLVDSVTGYGWYFFEQVVRFGSPASVVLWAFVVAGLALVLRRPRAAVFAIVGPGLTGLATTVFKPLIGRTVGGVAGGYAYPSGHTGGATAIALAAALLLVSLVPARRAVAATVVAAAALLAGGVVGAGMVTLGAHYPTDTVGGFCLAVALGLGAGTVIDTVADRWAARRAAVPVVPPSAPPSTPPSAPPPAPPG